VLATPKVRAGLAFSEGVSAAVQLLGALSISSAGFFQAQSSS
jgi:hypothetical protein